MLKASRDSLQPEQHCTRLAPRTRLRPAPDRTPALRSTRACPVCPVRLAPMPGTTATQLARPSARITHGTLRVPRVLRLRVSPYNLHFTIAPRI